MPIYEFYCRDCHTIFNFFSGSVNTKTVPPCPKCQKKLSRQVSRFAITGKAKEDNDMDDLPIDEGKMEQAMNMLAREAENINEDDPKQAANLAPVWMKPFNVWKKEKILSSSRQKWATYWKMRTPLFCPKKNRAKPMLKCRNRSGMKRYTIYRSWF